MNLDPEKIPVTILTGFLGAGKTTLLNRVLTEQSGGKFAVVVNEFGEIGIDADLIVAADDEIIEMTNGCVCCTIRSDLLEALDSLLKRFQKLDGILIETTGLADPAPVIQTFFLDDDLTDRISLDAVVTVVDAFHLISSLSENPEVAGQIALADVIVLNKLDLVEPGALAETESRLRALNNRANILRSERCAVPLANILGLAAFSFDALLEREPEFLESAPLQHNQHGLTSLSLSSARPIDPDDFIEWMRNVIRSYGSDLLRSKGVLAFPDEPRRFVFHGVQALQDGDFRGEWSPGEERMSRLVLIGRHLVHDELRAGFEACFAPPARKSAT